MQREPRSPRRRPAFFGRPAVLIAVTALVFGAFGLSAAAAPAGYVYYFRSFDQWTVICGRDDAGGSDNCTLSAPPPEIHGAESQVEIGHGPGDKAEVTMRVRGTLMPDAPFYLRVDARPPHQTNPNRFGEGGWTGEAAQTIIDELKAGQQVVVRWFVGPPPSPRDEVLSLKGFDEAMADLREKVEPGALSQSMPPPAPANATRDSAAGAVSDAAEGAAPATGAAVEAEAERSPAGGQVGSAGKTVNILSNHIGRAQLSSNVINREPVDELTSPVDVDASRRDAIFFFTEVVDFSGRTVTHRWEYGGNVVAVVPFPIGGDRWRVYSRKSVSPSQTGAWTVTATAPDGEVLARAEFNLQ